MDAGDLPHLFGSVDLGEGSEVLGVEAVGAPFARVGEHARSGGMSESPWNSARLKRRNRRLNPVPQHHPPSCRFSVETRVINKDLA